MKVIKLRIYVLLPRMYIIHFVNANTTQLALRDRTIGISSNPWPSSKVVSMIVIKYTNRFIEQ
jgi:hypothetical protein